MGFLFFIAFLILIVSHLSLKKRVEVLEEQLSRKTDNRTVPHAASTETHPFETRQETSEPEPLLSNGLPDGEPPTTAADPTEPFIPIPKAPVVANEVDGGVASVPDALSQPAGEFFLYAWFKEQTLIKVGSIIFFFGAVWFVSYAIEQNWISPLTRIMLGLLLAVGIYGVGHWRKAIESTQYQVLTVLGSAVFLGTVAASQFAFVDPVLPATLAFLLMLVSIGYTLLVAFSAKAEWLGVMAAVAGLVVPFLIKVAEPSAFLLLLYIMLLSAGFLLVVFVANWRAVSLVLLLGATLHLSAVNATGALSDLTLWIFAALFSALFFTGTTISLAKSERPELYDVAQFALITLLFVGYTVALAPLSGMALFVAATVVGFVGYAFLLRNAGADTVSLFAAMCLVNILVGTVELFDGFVLTIALALEALAVYLLTMRLATVQRSLYVAAALFFLPLVSGLSDLTDPAWNDGIVHAPALGVSVVIFTLGFAIVWTLRDDALRAVAWLRTIAGTLLVGWYGFSFVAAVVVARAIAERGNEVAVSVVLLSILAAIVILYAVRVVRVDSWRLMVLLVLLPPVIGAVGLMSDRVWQSGIEHLQFWASLLVLAGLIATTLLYWVIGRRDAEDELSATSAYGLLWLVLVYSFLFLSVVFEALLTGTAYRVVTAISYLFVTYLTVSILLLVRSEARKVIPILFALIVPGVMLLESIRLSGWDDGVFGIDAVGLYVAVTVLGLLGVMLLQQSRDAADDETKEAYSFAGLVLLGFGGLLLFGLVWMISRTVFASEALGVTIALFVYTIAGLAVYSYGRVSGGENFKRAGIALLGVVVLRLALIDVWGMELLWRIVTFMGIGGLFIVTALLERKQTTEHIVADPEG